MIAFWGFISPEAWNENYTVMMHQFHWDSLLSHFTLNLKMLDYNYIPPFSYLMNVLTFFFALFLPWTCPCPAPKMHRYLSVPTYLEVLWFLLSVRRDHTVIVTSLKKSESSQRTEQWGLASRCECGEEQDTFGGDDWRSTTAGKVVIRHTVSLYWALTPSLDRLPTGLDHEDVDGVHSVGLLWLSPDRVIYLHEDGITLCSMDWDL